MLRYIAVALALLASFGAAGCGDEDAPTEKRASAPPRSSYETTIRTIHTDMNDAMAAAFADGSLDEDRVREARTTAQDAAAKMDEAQVPSKYKLAHQEYARGLAAFVDILEDVEAQVDDPNVARRHLADKRFSTGVSHLERASRLYSDAGLDLDDAGSAN